jgi:hypothetical protein
MAVLRTLPRCSLALGNIVHLSRSAEYAKSRFVINAERESRPALPDRVCVATRHGMAWTLVLSTLHSFTCCPNVITSL